MTDINIIIIDRLGKKHNVLGGEFSGEERVDFANGVGVCRGDGEFETVNRDVGE